MKRPSIAACCCTLPGLALALAACGSNGSTADSGSPVDAGSYDGGPPTANFSGPFDASMPISVTAQVFAITNDGGVVDAGIGTVIAWSGATTVNGYNVLLTGATDISGPYDAGTYGADNPTVTGFSFTVSGYPAVNGNPGSWGAGYSAATQSGQVGSLSTVITDTGPAATGRFYGASHGSFTATLIDDVSDGGPLAVSGTF